MTGTDLPDELSEGQRAVARLFFALPESEGFLLAGEDVLVDLAIDTAPTRPPVATPIGPTFAGEELAGRKLLALFDRAEARDFADVRALAHRFGEDVLLERAAEIDARFDRGVVAEMMGAIGRFDDDELPVDDPDALRRFFAEWRDRLR